MYVIDTFNYTVRKITPSAAVTTLAGLAGAAGCTNGTGSAARFGYYPQGITCTPAGMIYVADTNAHTIRQVNQAGVVITLAGSCNVTGHADGTGSAARFKSPGGLVVDAYNDIYVADTSNYTVRKVTAGGVVTTVAGLALTAGHVDATGSSARFYYLHSIVADLIGNLYVFDSPAIIRKIAPGFVVTTFAGLYNTPGTTDGNGASARLNFGNLLIPGGMAGGFVDPSGNVYFADTSNYTIRRMSPTGDVVTLAGQAGNAGDADSP
jgi:sugar lactone lactonase YvrE